MRSESQEVVSDRDEPPESCWLAAGSGRDVAFDAGLLCPRPLVGNKQIDTVAKIITSRKIRSSRPIPLTASSGLSGTLCYCDSARTLSTLTPVESETTLSALSAGRVAVPSSVTSLLVSPMRSMWATYLIES